MTSIIVPSDCGYPTLPATVDGPKVTADVVAPSVTVIAPKLVPLIRRPR